MPDTPMHRETVTEMEISKLEEFIETKRQRLAEVKQFKQRVADASRKLDDDKAKERLMKQWRMLNKEIERVETAIQKVDKRIAEVRGLFLQVSDEGTL